MQESTEKLINESRRRLGYTHNIIDWVSCKYQIENNKVIVTPNMIALNMCDVYCDIEDVCTDPLSVYFDRALPTGAKHIDYDVNERELRIDDEVYRIKDYTDIGFFVGDLGCKDSQALSNLMENFGRWLIKNGDNN